LNRCNMCLEKCEEHNQTASASIPSTFCATHATCLFCHAAPRLGFGTAFCGAHATFGCISCDVAKETREIGELISRVCRECGQLCLSCNQITPPDAQHQCPIKPQRECMNCYNIFPCNVNYRGNTFLCVKCRHF
jgi:hypothetical protein